MSLYFSLLGISLLPALVHKHKNFYADLSFLQNAVHIIEFDEVFCETFVMLYVRPIKIAIVQFLFPPNPDFCWGQDSKGGARAAQKKRNKKTFRKEREGFDTRY